VSTLAVGLACALAASVALNGSFLLQHVGAASVDAVTPLHPLRTMRSLLAARAWTAGAVLGIAGWALHVCALTRAPLSLVQAFVAGGVALTVPVARWWMARPIGRYEVAAVLALAAALAILGTDVTATAAGRHLPAAELGAFLAATAVASVALAGAGVAVGRPALMAAASGLLYGGADVAIKVLTTRYSAHGVSGVLGSVWLPAAAVLTVLAFFAFQRSLQSGQPVAAIALMTAGTYVLSIGGGLAVLGDRLGHGAVVTTVHACALVVVVIASGALAGTQAGLAATAAER
jgi:hypothetical protein